MTIIILAVSLFFVYKPNNKTTNFFFLAIRSETYKNASIIAKEISSYDGAGYILLDNSYYVIISVYYNDYEAKKAKNDLSSDYPNAEIYKLTIKKTSQEIAKQILKTIDLIYRLNGLYAVGKTTFEDLNHTLLNLKNQYEIEYYKFLENSKSDAKLNPEKNNLTNIMNSLSILTDTNQDDIRSSLNYHLINIVFNLNYFLA